MEKGLIILILFLTLTAILIPVVDVQAISLMEGVNSDCWSQGGKAEGNCSVCDILRVIYNVGRFIFMSMAGIAMIMILWAAIGMIMNWGNAEAVAGAKKTILHTFLAILIIMVAWTLVNAIGWAFLGAKDPGSVSNLGAKDPGSVSNPIFWENGEWWTGPSCQ